MMARQRSWIPPRKRITTRSDVKPFGASDGSTKRSTICANAATTERPTVTNASHAIRSRGAYENERTARRAHLTFRTSELVDVPYGRSGRTYGTPVCRKPTHARRPRMNRSDSGSSLRASITRRSSREKSPASRGTDT